MLTKSQKQCILYHMQRFKQLDKRLSAIAELIREGVTVCDVGTDHARLPCHLARSGKYGQVYACELNLKPLEFARSQISHQKAEVVLIQSDGLTNAPPCDDVVIAGMGGELIAAIVSKMPKAFRGENLRLILQPMTRAEHLRRGLAESGFEIISEQSVHENNRDFIIIYARCCYDYGT
jgi:tRNA (adenine22-N1)-methyltransferase